MPVIFQKKQARVLYFWGKKKKKNYLGRDATKTRGKN